MQRKKKMFLGIGLFFLVFFIVFFIAYQDVHHPAVEKISSHAVLAIDMNNNNKITQEDIEQGKDAVLAIHSTANQASKHAFFSNIKALIALDTNKDNRIDSGDPTFSQMELVYLQPDKKRKYVSLEEAGIKAILIYKKKDETLNTKDDLMNDIVGDALLEDGQMRLIRAVEVEI
jgi:ABC-type uncharacterized transport system permease subunit